MNEKETFDNIEPIYPVDTESNPDDYIDFGQENNKPVAIQSFEEFLQQQNNNTSSDEPVIPVEEVDPLKTEEIINPIEVPQETVSYTEIPIEGVTEINDKETIEHPDAKITLKRKEAYNFKEIKENSEAVDKGTMMLLLWILIGLLIFIFALPYLIKLF